jgi:hypothetical protein
MTTNSEAVPTVWTASDEAFFRVVHQVFPLAFLAGAGVLLSSYDPELETVASMPDGVPSRRTATTAQPIASALTQR